VVFHLATAQMDRAPAWIRQISGHGYVAVNAFFILSGFILAHNYMAPQGLRGSVREFWIARFSRVYPLYLLVVLLGLPYRAQYSVSHPAGFQDAWACFLVITMMQAWFPSYALLINSAAWSLSAEAFFYAIFPLFVRPIANLSSGRATRLAVLCWIAGLTVPVIAARWYPEPSKGLVGFLWYNPLLHLPAFVMGIAAYRLFQIERPRLIRYARPICYLSAGGIVTALAVGGLIPPGLFQNGLLGLPFAALIIGLGLNEGPLAKFLAHRALVRLGDASYALYLLHLPLAGFAADISGLLGSPAASWGYPALAMAVSIGASLAAYSYIEIPYSRSVSGALQRLLCARVSIAGI
jgi:peptidoglycan/LPS O-acetylase OafA/YrhL